MHLKKNKSPFFLKNKCCGFNICLCRLEHRKFIIDIIMLYFVIGDL